MSWVLLVGFFVAILPLVITPGASFTLLTQRVLAGERHSVSSIVGGTATGIYIHALLAAAGLSAVVMHSAEAFTAVKIAGGVYLVALGVWTIWQTRRRRSAASARKLPWAGHHAYPQAVLANVLNPKAASIYLTLAPQFLTQRQVSVVPLLVLATVHVLAMAAWLSTWSLVLTKSRRVTRTERFKKVINRVGGTILTALGVRTVVT